LPKNENVLLDRIITYGNGSSNFLSSLDSLSSSEDLSSSDPSLSLSSFLLLEDDPSSSLLLLEDDPSFEAEVSSLLLLEDDPSFEAEVSSLLLLADDPSLACAGSLLLSVFAVLDEPLSSKGSEFSDWGTEFVLLVSLSAELLSRVED
jgi:hypothetical protein